MCRDREWRRNTTKLIVTRRLRLIAVKSNWWRGLQDINGLTHHTPKFINYIGLKDYFQSKSYVTPKWVTRRKIKYSPNKSKEYYRDNKKLDTREFRNKEFYKILKEYGIK